MSFVDVSQLSGDSDVVAFSGEACAFHFACTLRWTFWHVAKVALLEPFQCVHMS